MKSILWFVVGIAAGFVVAHQLNQTNQGREFFSSIDAKARAFGKAVAEAALDHPAVEELQRIADRSVVVHHEDGRPCIAGISPH